MDVQPRICFDEVAGLAVRMQYCFAVSRSLSNSRKVRDFMRLVGVHARGGQVFLTGGASAVIVG